MKKIKRVIVLSTLVSAALITFNSCNTPENSDTTEIQETETTEETALPAEQKLTDPEIASIAVTANQIDIEYANIALNKSQNEEVKKFANTMIKDHQAVIDQASALATKLQVTPLDNPITQSLLQGAEDIKADFNAKSGADFDKAYVDNEVNYHKAAISLVETRLVTESTNEELKALLQSALPIFKQHLAHAEMVQKSLAK